MDQQQSALKDEGSQMHKGRRRTRNDQNNRDFFCGCGKSYLSYPALYTHLKHKHDSKPPEGTLLPSQAAPKSGRGRPRRLDENDQKSKSDDDKSVSSNEPEETLEEMLIFFDSLGAYRQAQPPQDLEWAIENFPKELFTTKEDYQAILNYMTEIIDQRSKDIEPLHKEEIDPNKNIRKTPIYKIIAYFLTQVGPRLIKEAYHEIVLYSVFFCKSLNNLGYQALHAYENDQKNLINQNEENVIPKQETGNYCEDQNGEQILLTANEFILNMLPEYFKGLGKAEAKLQIFGSNSEKLKNAVYITQHLSQWLYAQKFTNSRLVLYTEDE